MTDRTLYRFVATWFGGGRLEREMESPPGVPRMWERITLENRPQGVFYAVPLHEFRQMQDRIARADRRAAAQRKSRAERNTRGQGPQHVLKAEAETPDATDRGLSRPASPGVGLMGEEQPADADLTGPSE